MTRLVVAWAGLLGLLLVQVGAATLAGLPASASVFGVAAASVVLLAFMRLRHGSSLMRIFAAAGLFWLVVLLTLGSLDPVTRTDYPAPVTIAP